MPTDPKPEALWAYKLIEHHQARLDTQRKTWAMHLAAYRGNFYGKEGGEAGAEDDDITVEHNHLYSFVDSLISNVCPTNPEVDIVARRRTMKGAARVRTALVNDVLLREQAPKKFWRLAATASVYPRAFTKTIYEAKRKRPKLRILPPHRVIYDMAAETWDDLRYICEITTITKAQFAQRLKKPKKGGHYRSDCEDDIHWGTFPDWLKADELDKRSGKKDETEIDITRSYAEYAVIYEYYDLVGEKYYHFAQGVEAPLMTTDLPYRLVKNPFDMLTFNDNLEDTGGLSDAHLIYALLQRLNELASLEMWHIQTAIPIPVIHDALLEDPEEFADAFQSATGPGHAIHLNARRDVTINDIMGQTPVVQLPIEWARARAAIIEEIERVLGLPAYQRGAAGQSDVATELALIEGATKTRDARRQKALYLVIAQVAKKIIDLYLEYLDPESDIPLRVQDGEEDATATRQSMNFPDLDAKGDVEAEEDWSWDYEARPFNADENNSVVDLKRLETYMPLLQGNPAVNQVRLTKRLLERLDLDGVANTEEEMAAAQQPPMMPDTGSLPAGDPNAGLPAPLAGNQIGAEAGQPAAAELAQELGAPLA